MIRSQKLISRDGSLQIHIQKIKKSKKPKIKNILVDQPQLILYNVKLQFVLTKYACLHQLGSNRLPQVSRIHSLPPHCIVTLTLCGMIFFYIKFEIDLQGRVTPSHAPTNLYLGVGDATTPAPKIVFYFIQQFIQIFLHIAKQMKNMNFYTIVIMKHRNKKIYQVYFNIYKS